MRQQKIIWAAIVVSTFIYAFLLYMLSKGWPQPGPLGPALQDQKTMIFYAMAVLTFALASVLPRFMSSKLAAWIPSLALFESSSIFGLLAAFLARDWRLFVAPWILSLIGFMTRFPSDGGEQA